jgi:uncharacterized protein (TIGR02597 family)
VNARPSSRSGLAALTALLTFGLGFEASAQSVTTIPVGAVTLTIAAGSGSSRVVTPLSFPLVDSASGVGQLKGQITGFSAAALSNSAAGWVAGQFSDPTIPCLIRITSGLAAGRTFLISTTTANTATTITIDSEEAGLVDLTGTGLAVGDSYSVFPCDTLSSLFGTPATTGVLGGTLATGAGADIVYVMVSGGWRQYYYNTGTSGWKRIGLNTSSDNIPVRPDSLVLYSRIGDSAMNLVLTGEVPALARKQIVRKSGVTPLANPWPSGVTTLSSSHIADMAGWLKSADYTQADVVLLMVSGGWRQYFHDGVNWRRVGLNSISDGVEIPVGSGVQINKRGSDVSSVDVSPATPYTL